MTRRLVLPVLLLLAISACGETDTKLKVTGIEPEKGDVDGGTYVRLKGNRFTADGPRNVKVYFGKDSSMRQGTVVRFASDSELIVEAPGGKPNEKADVLIIFDPGGKLTIKDGFTFVEKNDTAPSVQDLDISKPKK
jgi:hypothetical protein